MKAEPGTACACSDHAAHHHRQSVHGAHCSPRQTSQTPHTSPSSARGPAPPAPLPREGPLPRSAPRGDCRPRVAGRHVAAALLLQGRMVSPGPPLPWHPPEQQHSQAPPGACRAAPAGRRTVLPALATALGAAPETGCACGCAWGVCPAGCPSRGWQLPCVPLPAGCQSVRGGTPASHLPQGCAAAGALWRAGGLQGGGARTPWTQQLGWEAPLQRAQAQEGMVGGRSAAQGRTGAPHQRGPCGGQQSVQKAARHRAGVTGREMY